MDNFIEVYNNVFSKEYCDEVIKNYNIFAKAGFDINRQQLDKTNKLDKEDSAVFFPSLSTEHFTPSISEEFTKLFWEIAYKNYAEKYSILRNVASHSAYIIKVQKTMPGQGYHIWHCETDNRLNCHRLLAWAVYLNDDFEAGETEFLYQQYRYKPKQGDAIIFPAAFTHTHRGNPPINGTKYIMTGWVEF